jgi:hypothetical protein
MGVLLVSLDGSDIPCVIYAANSTEDRRGSIPDQLGECRAAIERASGRDLVAEYSDEAFSAFRRSRGPGLVDAMQHAEDLAREFGSAELWAQHSDRLARGDGRSARHAVEVALWDVSDIACSTEFTSAAQAADGRQLSTTPAHGVKRCVHSRSFIRRRTVRRAACSGPAWPVGCLDSIVRWRRAFWSSSSPGAEGQRDLRAVRRHRQTRVPRLDPDHQPPAPTVRAGRVHRPLQRP